MLQSTQAFSIHSHPLQEMGRVALILVNDHTASQVFGRACTCSLQGKPVLVPRSEHLAAMKAAAIAQQPERPLKDLADVQFLLTLPSSSPRQTPVNKRFRL